MNESAEEQAGRRAEASEKTRRAPGHPFSGAMRAPAPLHHSPPAVPSTVTVAGIPIVDLREDEAVALIDKIGRAHV